MTRVFIISYSKLLLKYIKMFFKRSIRNREKNK